MSLTERQKRIKKQVHDYCKDISKMLTEKILRLRIEVIELKPCNVLLNNTRYVYTPFIHETYFTIDTLNCHS